MEIVVLSYRADYEIRHRGEYEGGRSSAFSMALFPTAEAAASWIATQLLVDIQAEYSHLVFTSWKDLVQFAESPSCDVAKGEKSVSVPFVACFEWDENYGAEEEAAREEACGRLNEQLDALVLAAMKEKSQAAIEARRLHAEQLYRESQRRNREAELKRRRDMYEELKKEFEGNP